MRRSPFLSVVLALLLATSMPATAAMASTPSPVERPTVVDSSADVPAIQTDGAGETDENRTLLDLTDRRLNPEHRLAISGLTLLQINATAGDRRDPIDRATVDLNASLGSYRAHRPTDRAAFDRQADALHTLSNATGSEHDDRLANVSRGVIEAGNGTARTAIRHLNTTPGLFGDQVSRERLNYTERAIADANIALERAETHRATIDEDNWTLQRQIRRRANTVDHYREVNHHVRRALDELEEGVDPRLRLIQREGVERDGQLLVPVQAQLTDVRAWIYENATATVRVDGQAGNQTQTASAPPISLSDGLPGDSFAGGTTMVPVPADASNATVTVNATAVTDANRTATATVELDLDSVRPDPATAGGEAFAADDAGVTVDPAGEASPESIVIANATPDPGVDHEFRAGPVVQIENTTPVEGGTVTMPIDGDVAGGAANGSANLSVYRWDPETPSGWSAVETTVDAENGTATADVDGFSFFSVFAVDDWNALQTSSVTLEDRHVEGSLNDTDVDTGTAGGQVDVVFVMDESGSMGGSPIEFAREAGKRFVAALLAEERAAVVGYASGASRDQSLTTDHDGVNASIDALSAGGGTDTEAGIRAGLAELEENGYENRSDLIVLLSDGNSNAASNPRDAASDAAEQGVEISTVGLGSSIDEAELRDIANATGGDFLHVQDASDLPETFERVAANRSGLTLTDSSGDGIPDAVADANPVIPALAPFEPVEDARVNLDPFVADTSGDGLLDNDTVEIEHRVTVEDNETVLEATVESAEHHPARVDTTGDGLLDREQVEGWQIRYTDGSDASVEYLSTLQQADNVTQSVLADAGAHLRTRTVRPNPLLNHSDGDGLPDVEERDLGTGPGSFDTTGDGVPDDAALAFDADPTLYDFQGPEMTVLNPNWRSPDVDVDVEASLDPIDVDVRGERYSFTAQLFDPAELGEARVLIDGDLAQTEPLEDRSEDFRFSETLSLTDSSINALTGATVVLESEDRLGNEEETVAVQQHGFYGELALEFAGQIDHPGVAQDLGSLSGFTAGAGGLADLIAAAYSDPRGFVEDSLGQAIQLIRNLDEFDRIVAAMAESLEAQQESTNPYNETAQPELHDSYREGWYAGQAAWMAVEMVVPAGELGRAASSSSRVQSTLGRLRDAGRLGDAVRSLERVGSGVQQGRQIARYQLSRGVRGGASLGREGAERLVSAAPTTGVSHAAAQAWRRLDPRTRRIAADGSGDLDESFRRAVARAADGDDVSSVQNAVRRIDALDGVQRQRAMRLVADTDADGLRLIDELGDQQFSRLVEMESNPGYDGFSDWDTWRQNLARSTSEADPENINQYVDDVHRAGESDVIENERGIVYELADPNPQRSDFNGQRGEAARAVHYAEEVDDVSHVEIEPGDGEYDLRLERAGGEEFVEVKTPDVETSPDFGWWDRRVSGMNRQFSNTDEVSRDQAVLEVHVERGSTDLDAAEGDLRDLLNTRMEPDFREVRIQVEGGETISVETGSP